MSRTKLDSIRTALLILFVSGMASAQTAQNTPLAATPPLGWNSWDAYGTTVSEADLKRNANWMAQHLRAFGWQYVVVDEGWFVSNPTAHGDDQTAQRTIDSYGRYMPAVNRFPSASNGRGFAPLAAYVHGLGLKFGIHILQGIPREAVRQNLSIADSIFRAPEAANTTGECSWNPDNYDLRNTAAGQAYYDSIARLYASWGVDFIKIDCIASRPYKADEIRMFHDALAKTGRPIVLSLSPGEPPHERTADLQRYAQMWRISDDTWDLWASTKSFPQGVNDQFARLAQWTSAAVPGHWPDADMLPLGSLAPAPGYGSPRLCQLTHPEQQTMFTLWSIFRSPLMLGGNLPETDAWTLSLLTNPDVLAIDQSSTDNRSIVLTAEAAVWSAKTSDRTGTYLAVFNRSDIPKRLHWSWKQLGLPTAQYQARDLWLDKELGVKQDFDATLEPHASLLLLLTAAR